MGTGAMIDFLLLTACVTLVVASVAAAFWPPHYHRYNKIDEHTDRGVLVQRLQCVCGKSKTKLTPLEEHSA
jgi:hypothetical protein